MLMKNKNMTVPNCLAGVLAALSLVANACIAAEVHVLNPSGKTIYPESIAWSAKQGKFFVGSVLKDRWERSAWTESPFWTAIILLSR
jgi:hypothetical protein